MDDLRRQSSLMFICREVAANALFYWAKTRCGSAAQWAISLSLMVLEFRAVISVDAVAQAIHNH